MKETLPDGNTRFVHQTSIFSILHQYIIKQISDENMYHQILRTDIKEIYSYH